MRKPFVIAVTISISMPIFGELAQSAGSCPTGFQVVYDIKEFCIASFKGGSCPSGSTLFTMDGRPLCLHSRSPEAKASVSLPKNEQPQPALREEKEIQPSNVPRLAPDPN
jgi:hypothetical protein